MQIYNPKFGWVTIPEQTSRPVPQTRHRIVSESSLQGLDQIVIQLLATKASDPGSILKHVQDVIKQYNEQEWHRNNGQGAALPAQAPAAQPPAV